MANVNSAMEKSGAKTEAKKVKKTTTKHVRKAEAFNDPRKEGKPHHRELDAILMTLINGLKVKLGEVDFDSMDDEIRANIRTDLSGLVDYVNEKLGNT